MSYPSCDVHISRGILKSHSNAVEMEDLSTRPFSPRNSLPLTSDQANIEILGIFKGEDRFGSTVRRLHGLERKRVVFETSLIDSSAESGELTITTVKETSISQCLHLRIASSRRTDGGA